MKVVDIAQRTDEWLAWRKGGVTATMLAVILGENPDKTRRQLWLELKGYITPPDLSVIPQVRKGAAREPLALQAFEDKHGVLGLPICAEHGLFPFIRASFDGLLEDNRPVEIKNLAEGNHLEVLEKKERSSFYQLYQWQVKHQLVISGGTTGFLWFWSPKHTPVLLRVTLSEDERVRIVKACTEFWDSIIHDEIPEADPLRDELPIGELSQTDQKKWAALSASRRDLETEIAKHKKELARLQLEAKSLEDEFLSIMGDFRTADHLGIRAKVYDKAGTVDWEAVARSLKPDLTTDTIESFRRSPSTGTRFTVDAKFTEDASAKPIPIYQAKRSRKQQTAPEEQPKQAISFWF
ncbi:MAG: YqaJ viral recombinase family protein [Halopseudomonas aestusnigri]|nr:YqaJ viral recombinase family protein [Halopseudomonas aestusnigri]